LPITRREFLIGGGSVVAASAIGAVVLNLGESNPALVATDDFYAYYTRLGGVRDEPDGISGPYADVVVNVGSQHGLLVFSREFSYRPRWQCDAGGRLVDHLAEINGDGPVDGRFDRSNQYAYARVIESDPKQVRMEWRYFPDHERLDPTGVVQELYLIERDGRVTREHRPGTETIDAWDDPLNLQGVDDGRHEALDTGRIEHALREIVASPRWERTSMRRSSAEGLHVD
jgi:hypothetical protein